MENTRTGAMHADDGNSWDLGGGIDDHQSPPDLSDDGCHRSFTVFERRGSHRCRVTAAGGAPEPVIRGRGRVGAWIPMAKSSTPHTARPICPKSS